jgi:signal transduction histidine kinase
MPNMNASKNENVFGSMILSLVVAAGFLALWEAVTQTVLFLKDYLPADSFALRWWQIVLFLVLATFSGFLAERYSIKRVLPLALGLVFLWSAASFFAAIYFGANTYFLRTSFVILAPLAAVHFKRLWRIDSELTDKLVSLTSTGHLLEGKPAELRIESGLKLLETILPLSDAIVFHFDRNGNLAPVGRARGENGGNCAAGGGGGAGGGFDSSPSLRQISWRESISLCETALKSQQTQILPDESGGQKGAAQIALPLIYEGAPVGVLFVKVRENFERADQNLLEAFSGQLARNFQRRELRSKDLPNKFWWSFLSTQSAENRVDIIKLINGLMKEQAFGAMASSYLKEAHAIAYLDGTLAYLNRQMRHLAKLNPEHIYELDLFSLLERFKTDIFNEPALAVRRVLQTGDYYKGELYYPEKNRTLKLQISLVKVPSDSQSIHETNVPLVPACFLITIRDISVIKENEKLRSDMTSLMSHELRTPITSIKGFAELLMADETISEENREFLEIIANESDRLAKMLTTFLSVSNLEQSDKQEFVKSPVKLDAVVSEVVEDLQETAKRKRIRLVEQSNKHLPPIAADKGLIARALAQLVDNAIKYSPERTSVIISTILESEFLRVVVEDRGYGIPKTEQDKIWQKFYRVAREGQDKEEESTGLGLPLVKEIIEQHGGQVEVESEVGFGSRFSLKLPRL